jgi:CheY-like chemotaxis protein
MPSIWNSYIAMKTVLIADNEPSILETTRFILEAAGYTVLPAADGLHALELLRRRRPPVAFLDVMMPGLDGYAVCRAVRQDPELAATHLIILTAKGQSEDERRALEAGADAYMRKPFHEEVVLAHLQRVFEARAE